MKKKLVLAITILVIIIGGILFTVNPQKPHKKITPHIPVYYKIYILCLGVSFVKTNRKRLRN